MDIIRHTASRISYSVSHTFGGLQFDLLTSTSSFTCLSPHSFRKTDYLASCFGLIFDCPWSVFGRQFPRYDCDDDDDTKNIQPDPS